MAGNPEASRESRRPSGLPRSSNSFILRRRRTSVFMNPTARSGFSSIADDEVLIGGGEAFRVACRGDGRGSRARVDQAHFAEHFTGLKPANSLGSVAAADGDIDHPADDEERRIALLALTDDRLSGLERNLLHGTSTGASRPATSLISGL